MLSPVRVDWDRRPVSLHHDDLETLEKLIEYLSSQHGVKRHSIVMPDRTEGGFVAFLYQACDPNWIISWQESCGD